MGKLQLPTVTLVACASDVRYLPGTVRAIERCTALVDFANVVLFTDWCNLAEDLLSYITPVKTEPFLTRSDASIFGFQTWRSADYFSEHVLSVGWDGWVINPRTWSDDFLQYDWVGATWPDGVVGNNGFGLVSKKLIMALSELNIPYNEEYCHPFDAMVCRNQYYDPAQNAHKSGYRSQLESMGLAWAPVDVANRFSIENAPYHNSFGFHGTQTLVDIVLKGLL